MIDCEDELFREVSTALRQQFPGLYITGATIRAAPRFPCVSIVQRGNQVWRNGRDSTHIENFVEVMVEVEIYSNKTEGKKAECKTLAAAVDAILATKGFTRIMLEPLPNLADDSIYRMTGRYRAIISEPSDGNFTVYKR